MKAIKNLLLSNCNLKLISLVIGYGLWFLYSQSTTIQLDYTIPVCFYAANQEISSAPESVVVTLQAKRSDILQCDLTNLAVHINSTKLKPGNNLIAVNEKTLFLPESIKMVYCKPQPLEIKL